MNINPIQIILVIFLWFALSRVILQFRLGQISPILFSFWAVIFTSAIFVVFLPNETTLLAQAVGIGRGVDLAVYASIVILFYLVFRIYVYIESVRHDITKLVRQIALENSPKQKIK